MDINFLEYLIFSFKLPIFFCSFYCLGYSCFSIAFGVLLLFSLTFLLTLTHKQVIIKPIINQIHRLIVISLLMNYIDCKLYLPLSTNIFLDNSLLHYPLYSQNINT